MDIIYLLHVLWRKKWIIIAIPIISAIAAFFFTQSLKPTYKAKTQIATGFTTNEGVNIMDDGFSIRDAQMKFNNLMATMNSSTIINMVSYRLIMDYIQENQGTANKLTTKYTETEIKEAKKIFQEKLATFQSITVRDEKLNLLEGIIYSLGYSYGFLKEGFNINRLQTTDYIEVAFTSHDPDLSADAVNTFVDEFIRFYVSNKKESSSESVTFIKELVERKKEELDNKTEAIQTFKANNNMVSSSPQGDAQTDKVYQLETERDQINNTIYGLRLKLENYKNSLSERTGGTTSSTGNASNQRIIDLKKKIDIMNERFISSGANNTALLDSVNLLRQQYKMELSLMERGGNAVQASGMTISDLNQAINDTQIDLQVQESRLRNVTAKLYNIRGSLSGYASKEAILNTLERDLQVASDEYLAAVEKYNDAQNQLMAASGTIRQVNKAAPPATPEASKRLILIAVSGIASFSLTIFVIVVIEVIDRSIKTTEQYQRLIGLPLAGTLIKIDTKKLNFPALFGKKHENKELELFKHFLRKIRFEIENSGGRTFLITSPKEGEGKTFITFSLAFVLSLVKKRVLIIDTNFKNNALTKWLVVPKKNLKYIDQKARGADELKIFDKGDDPEIGKEKDLETDFVTPTKYKNIFIIGNSGGYESPEEIFHNKDFHSLIDGLSLNFDYILMEGPAMNEFSDSKELIKYVDKIIPVFSAESSVKQLDKETIQFLESLNGKLTGSILNLMDAKNLNV